MRSHTCKETCCVVCGMCYEGHLPQTIKGYTMKGHDDLMNLQTFSPTYSFKI